MKKLILITGVSRGLGRAMTEGFIKQGHTVVGCARKPQDIEKLQQEFGDPHHFISLDVMDEVGVETWAKIVHAKYGAAIDLLINNAGIINPWAPFLEIKSDIFNQLIDINVKGVANIVRHFLPKMLERKQGIVVNFSSGWGRYTSANVVPFCTSKWAIEGFTKALAQELPLGMAAVSLWPGSIRTDMAILVRQEKADDYIPPHEWSKVAVPFLLQIGPSDNGKPLSIPTG
ncbi:MAG: SDR family oxidoreductase [Cyanobacteria bacterium P01_F01_bin.150]